MPEGPSKSRNTKAAASTKELGVSGLNFSGGQVQEELLGELRGDRAIRIYEQMALNDSLIGGILFAIDMLIRQVEWAVEPHPEGTDEDVEYLESCMDDMSHSWVEFISEILTMLPFGFSFFESVYKIRQGPQAEGGKMSSSKFSDGKVGWRKFAIRAQSSLAKWDFDDDGGLRGFVQRAAPKYEEVTIPIEKGLLFRTSVVKGNPEGRSILRTAYRSWYFKKRMEEIEGVGIERDLAGLPTFRIDADIMMSSDPSHIGLMQSARQVIQNVRQDKEAGIILPIMKDENGNDLIEFTLMNSGGSRTFDITNVIERYDKRIASSVLADFILLGQDAVGSYALSSDKTSLFAQALGAWLQTIEEVINRFAVARLWRVNGWDATKAPKIVHKDIEKPDLMQLSQFLQTLAQMGMPMFPDEDLEKHLRELADLPEPSEDTLAMQDEDQQKQLEQMMGGGQEEEQTEEEAPPDEAVDE